MPTLYEVMADDDFLPELRQNNELLTKFLTKEKMNQIVLLAIKEPEFNDMPDKCFKLPFVATEALCIDNNHIKTMLLEDE